MADAFEKLKSSINRGITTISVKTSSSLEKTKLKTHMDSLKNEIQSLYYEVGQATYNKWLSTDSNCSAVDQLCSQIQQKQQQITELTEELSAIDDRDNQILGTKTEKAPVANIVCPNCGAGYESPVKFCRSCGFKLSE